MSSAYDYASGVAVPPTSAYGPPKADFSNFSDALTNFVKGREEGRSEDQARAFRNGIPKTAGGDFDYNAIADTAARTGGINYAMPLLQLQAQRQAGQQGGAAIEGGTPQAAPQSPDAIPPQASVAAPPMQPQTAGTPANAPNSIISSLPDSMPDEVKGPLAVKLAKDIGADPNAALNPRQSAMLKNRLASLSPDQAGVANDSDPSLAASPGLPAPVMPNASPNDRVAQGFTAATPNAAQPTVPVPAPRPAGAPGPVAQAGPGAPQPTAPQVPQEAPVAGPTTPPGTLAMADAFDHRATQLNAYAARLAPFNKDTAAAVRAQADMLTDRSKQIREQIATASTPTPELKNYNKAVSQGYKGSFQDYAGDMESKKTAATEEAKLGAVKYQTLVDNGVKAQQEIPQLELLQEQMNDPNFYSGVGEKYNLLAKRLKSAVGIDPDAAVPQELLRKVTASNVLSSLGSLKGLGQIRVAEINMAREAAAAPDNSVPANKLLVEVAKRTHQRNADIADMAQSYKEQNGSLDAGFDKQVTAYGRQHPIFSDAEIKDWHKTIGEAKQPKQSADQPFAGKQFATPDAARAAGAKAGDIVTDANGKQWRLK